MTNSLPWKDPPIFKNGKPSISIRAIYTMAMLVITIAYPMLKPEFQAEFSENTRPSNGIS